ncbi:hypothetical protein [Klebsiella sp. BIGb0407]|uniref:hypothetical protein n=1 Tax=Klebsiella sp. BIGb0407 TaxID=2940603 RepID=UPI0021695308|nr:hypothetical protein [Klebsiella sp. BIGb0407]MCS3433516.1 hypothetical protein [Klebsiella sp. BIGb0407]
MGIQIIVKADQHNIEHALGSLYSESEVFPVSRGVFGLSIPTKIIDKVGEDEIFRRLEQLERY